MRISDWSSDVCSSDLPSPPRAAAVHPHRRWLDGKSALPVNMLGVTDQVASRAAMASVAAASVLLVLKSYAAWATGSVAMLGSLADSGLDLLASVIALYSVRLAAQPADADHRFGHGKAEAIAALFQDRKSTRLKSSH